MKTEDWTATRAFVVEYYRLPYLATRGQRLAVLTSVVIAIAGEYPEDAFRTDVAVDLTVRVRADTRLTAAAVLFPRHQ